MAMNNRDRVGKSFDYLAEGLEAVVDDAMTRAMNSTEWNIDWAEEDAQKFGTSLRTLAKNDAQVQLRAITEKGYYFKEILSRAQQGWASELREYRNRWAHGDAFSSDDAIRALDTIQRLLQAVDAPDSAADVQKLLIDLQRRVFEEQTRGQTRRAKVALDPAAGLPPWRDIIRPHDDVARGEFTASEFAADLHLVQTGQATSPEYGDPVEFFSRTYLTEGLRDLLSRALQRIGGTESASPVVNLQTNFGGGKTHSMLALYHLFSGTTAQKFPQEIQELIENNGNPDLPQLPVKRVALVGTYLQPGSPIIKEDGTEVHTLWGELAWQLGGRDAFDIVADADSSGTNPGESLRTLIQKYSPALILIDEWVAYARQLLTDKELPAGSFDTQFTFAQNLTEIVRSVPGAMLVVSIPTSDTGGAANDLEIGGSNGQLALDRLQNVIRRVADQWRPSSKDESFEIVKRRLFQDPDATGRGSIATVARSFTNMYRENASHFPRESAAAGDDYESRIRASYPLHPELLDRLYEDWSTLPRFQRTRGVLKLVSSIVHELWDSRDSSPLILPGNVPLDATSVNTDLTQYLEDQWKPIIDSDIDGPGSTAHEIDRDRPSLGQRFVTQRLARTIFMGAAPRLNSTRKGLDKQYLWLGTAIPGDTLGNFGMAVEHLSQRSTYFYEEQGHYWFDTQPSVTKTANDYAERLREDPDTVWNEVTKRLHSEERSRGSFSRVHVAPESIGDIPDVEETRLVIAHPRYSRRRQDGADSPASQWVREAIESKGASQRIHRNTLIFLLADSNALESLESATRNYLGWKQVQVTRDSLNLSTQQHTQTDEWVSRLDRTVSDRIRDTYIWAAYPEQFDPTKQFEIVTDKVPDSGGQSLAERVSTKLGREEQLITVLGAPILGTTLRTELANLWNDAGEISVAELWSYFTRYTYMPRLVSRHVLDQAVESALGQILVPEESFAIASGKDVQSGRYQNLLVPPNSDASIQVTKATLLIDVHKAQEQIAADQEALRKANQAAAVPPDTDAANASGSKTDQGGATTDRTQNWPTNLAPSGSETTQQGQSPVIPSVQAPLSRFFGSVKVDSSRYSRDIGNVTREVIDRLAGAGADLEITIDIQATKPRGFDESEVRTIGENARTLKFDPTSGFEAD